MSFLAEILPEIRTDLASPEYLAGLPASPLRPAPSLRRALDASGGWSVMVEHKRRSPGATEPDLPARSTEAFARLAAAGGAAALSCLATGPRFAGAPKDVAHLAAASHLPILFKDFVVDPIQIDAARRAGASAILLIARLESEGRLERPLAELSDLAHAAGLEVLLEFHASEELKVAERVRAEVYGVNLRDLDTLAFRPSVASATAQAASALRPLLGLSGVEDAAAARRWASRNVDGILVGTGFARSSDPVGFLRSLREVGAGPGRSP